tara:strand:+ start:1754 stop:1900 length:147 start_codon:yes stop_codon:yes gene_type:complete
MGGGLCKNLLTYGILIALIVVFASCSDKGWQPKETILLDGVAPKGITH